MSGVIHRIYTYYQQVIHRKRTWCPVFMVDIYALLGHSVRCQRTVCTKIIKSVRNFSITIGKYMISQFEVTTMLALSEHIHLPLASRAVLVHLSAYMDSDGEAWPSQELMAKRLGVSDRTIRRHLRDLEEAGYVTTKQLSSSRNNLYQVHFEAIKKDIELNKRRANLKVVGE